MKISHLITLALVAFPLLTPLKSSGSPVAATFCRTQDEVVDAGYELSLSEDGHRAELVEQTIAGPRKVANLTCRHLPQRACPDCINNYLVCRDRKDSEKGILVRLYAGGVAGLQWASVRRRYPLDRGYEERELRFGHLLCKNRP